jgi:hypothetical protein
MSRIAAIPVLIWWVTVLAVVYPLAGYAEPTEGEAKCQCPCPCPEAAQEEPTADSEECPETIVMKQLVEVYEEVEFSHAEHADLVDEGCGTCHHHTPVGDYRKCGACHAKGLFETDKLNLINLKAAYHRQCIECHVEWESGPTGCTECHEIRE